MKRIACTLFLILLSGCATTAVDQSSIAQRARALFNDAAFTPPAEKVDATQIFAVSDAMRRYLQVDIAPQLQSMGYLRGLIDALYSKQHLKIDYDAELTRTAAQTFDARVGNCLSLVIMTAALSKQLGLRVYYQRVAVEETWTRAGGLYFASGHVNITLGRVQSELRMGHRDDSLLTIDFYPQAVTRRALTWSLEESTIVAMYFNNRAAEALAKGDINQAYWWTREAILADASFVNSYNTLGVVYRRRGDLLAAEAALMLASAIDASNLHVMSNLAIVLNEQGRLDEALALNQKIDRLRPEPPFHFFNAGMAALERGELHSARSLFAKEVERAPYSGEFHYWLGVAHARLGEVARARAHLALALEYSATRKEHAIYAAKLDFLQASRLH